MELPKEDKQNLLTLSTVNVANFVPTKLWFSETKSNYKTWKEQMLCLLESQGLVDFISKEPQPTPKSTANNPPTNNQEDIVWKRTDWLIKGWILGSINDKIASTLLQKQSTTSRDVWLELKSMFLRQVTPVVHPLDKQADLEQKDFNSYLPLYTAIIDEKWEEANQMIKADDQGSLERGLARSITITTALQVAVGTGKGIEKLVELVDVKDLENLVDNYGTTVLGIAATIGNKETAESIVKRAPQLLYIPNSFGDFPAHIAAQFSHKVTLEYLLDATDSYYVSQFNYLPHPYGASLDGLRLLTDIIDAEFIDVALKLVAKNPVLARMTLPDGTSALKKIAEKKSLFFSCRGHTFWDHIISYLFRNLHAGLWEHLEQLVPSIKKFKEKSLEKQRALELVTSLCEEMEPMRYAEAADVYFDAILIATELEIDEVVDVIVGKSPTIISRSTPEDSFIFQMAVQTRSVDVFKLICKYQTNEKHIYSGTKLDEDGSNLLHLVGRLGPSERLNEISCAALQIKYELQWYQEVENFVHPYCRRQRNKYGKTPKMVFTEEHKTMIEDGEKWMKDTAVSYTVAAALIATLMFAAAITVPGGNEGNTGFPIFSKNVAFIVFAYADCASLFTSTISLLIFLSILILRYAAEDFLDNLPRRLIYGLGFLFLSIAFMMVAFTATVYLVFGQKKNWVLIPTVIFASLPIILFILLQYSLLKDLFFTTFGSGIFGRKSNRIFQ